jgi:hypothetical protein
MTPPPDNRPEPPPASPLPDYEVETRERRSIGRFLIDLFSDLRFRIVTILLVLGLAGWFGAPPVYRKVKIWRANQLMAQCEAAAEIGNMPRAISLMRQAILMAPGNPVIFQKVRLFNASLGDPGALGILQSLMMDDKASPEEILVVAEQSLRIRQPAITKTALEKLADHPSARRTIVEMRLLALEGKPQEGVELSRTAMKDFPPVESEKILLATAELVLQTNPDVARDILRPLAEKPDATGLASLRHLAAQLLALPESQRDECESLAGRIEAHPLRNADDALLATELRLLTNPAARPALLAQLSAERALAGEEDAIAYARWLNRRQAHREAIEFIGSDRARSNSDWLLVYLDAHAGLDLWSEIFALLENASVAGLSDSIRMLFLARAAKESGDTAKADEIWLETQRSLVFEKPEVISFIAAYAMRTGEREQAIKAYTTLSRRKETALEGYLGLIRCWPPNAPASEILPVYQSFVESFPNIPEAANDLTYLQLLTNRDLFDATLRALEAHRNNPNTLAPLSIAALAHLRNNEPAKAEALYEGRFIPWSTAPAPWKTIRAAVLLANGKTSEADELLATIERFQLRPEERALLPAE